MMSKIVLLSD